MKPTLLILAAGMGSRYGGLKQVDPVGPAGESIIDYSIYDAIRAGFGKVVFVIRESFAKAFQSSFDKKLKGKIDIEYVFQELNKVPEGIDIPEDREKPWGTGHAVLVAKDVIDEPFVVINADDYYGPEAYQVLNNYLGEQNSNTDAAYAMVGYLLKQTLSDFGVVSRGICKGDDQQFLVDVVENFKILEEDGIYKGEVDEQKVIYKGDELVSMNIWGFMPSFFNYLEEYFKVFIKQNVHQLKAEFYIPFVANELIKSGRATVKVLKSIEKWFGVTYKEDKPYVVQKIRELIDKGVYPDQLWN